MSKATTRRIVCPTDFSDGSRRALDDAIALARWHGAALTVLHAHPDVPTRPHEDARDSEGHERFTRALDAFIEPAREVGLPVRIELRAAPPVDAIVAEVQAGRADLVVMGTHGRSGFERLMLGSVTEKVLRKVSCPVLTVPPPHAVRNAPDRVPFQSILCPIDFSPASLRALDHALSLAEGTSARLRLLHVLEFLVDPEDDRGVDFSFSEYRQHLERDMHARLHRTVPEALRARCAVSETLTGGDPARQVLRVAGEVGADLIAMGAQGRGPVERIFLGSIAEHVIRGAACPVLTLPDAA